jgi:hypothetical protein
MAPDSAFASGNGPRTSSCGARRRDSNSKPPRRHEYGNKRASLILMCTRCVPAVDFVIMEWVQKRLPATKSGICSVVPPTGFEPALPPPEGETGRGWLMLVGVAKGLSAP